MTRRMPWFALACVLAVAVPTWDGCGRSAPPPTGGGVTATAGGGGVEGRSIRVVRNLGGRKGFQAHWDAWKATFEGANPGWTMDLIDLGNSSGGEYYKARVATGDLPEVLQTWNLTNSLADNGLIVPIPDDYYQRHGVVVPAAYKGKYYTTQGGLQLLGVAVNMDLWQQAGVTGPPATWDEFMADLERISAADIPPLAFGGKEWSASMPLSEFLQINLYDQSDPDAPSWTARRDAGQASFRTEPVAHEAVRQMRRLIESCVSKGAMSDGYNEEQRDFYGGKAATWIMGCWIGGDLEANKVPFDVDYWPIPPMAADRKPKFVANIGGQSGWAISKTAASGEMYDKAVAVLDAFYEPEVFQLYLNGEAMLNNRSDQTVKGPKTDWPQAQRFYDNMAARYAQYGGFLGSWRSCEDRWPSGLEMSLMRVMQEMVAGSADADSLLGTLDSDWDNARKGE